MTAIEKAAQAFAHKAHDSINQKRKYTGAPYWVHTDEVPNIIRTVTDDPVQLCGGHLHDVLEDVYPLNPYFSPELIREEFGDKIFQIVFDLTDQYTKENYPQWNREIRKLKERQRLGLTSPESQTVKLADLIANTADIVRYDKSFAKVYLREKELLLPHLIQGNAKLWVSANLQAQQELLKLNFSAS